MQNVRIRLRQRSCSPAYLLLPGGTLILARHNGLFAVPSRPATELFSGLPRVAEYGNPGL